MVRRAVSLDNLVSNLVFLAVTTLGALVVRAAFRVPLPYLIPAALALFVLAMAAWLHRSRWHLRREEAKPGQPFSRSHSSLETELRQLIAREARTLRELQALSGYAIEMVEATTDSMVAAGTAISEPNEKGELVYRAIESDTASEITPVLEPSAPVDELSLKGMALGAWLPNSRYQVVESSDSAFIARFVILTPIPDSLYRIEDDARVALVKALRRSPLQEWLADQMVMWSLSRQDQWDARGPINSNRAVALSWRASLEDTETILSAQCLALLPGTWAPYGALTQLLDVALQPDKLGSERRDKLGALVRIPLYRLAALLSAGIRTLGAHIPEHAYPSLGLKTEPRVPGCVLYTWPEDIDHYVDFGYAARIEGKTSGHGGNFEPIPAFDPGIEENRHRVVQEWLHQLLADEGFPNVNATLQTL